MRRSFIVFFPLIALAQAPVVETGGVQNTASNFALTSIAPQVVITIKGQNLATSAEAAHGYPLPTTLGGATVTFTGASGPVLAPLFYASPAQINAQVPKGITGTSIVVTTKAGSSAPYTVPLVIGTYPYAIGPLGIFTQDTSGCGQAVAYNVHTDGSVSLNTPQNSLDPERDAGLTFYLTGLGGLDYADRQDGVRWTYNSGDNLAPRLVSSVTLGAPGLTATAANLSLAYMGPAPGKVGIDQANVLGQRKGWPQGCKVPLSVSLLQQQVVNDDYLSAAPPSVFAPFSSSQLVDVSIQPGGGACLDPPDSGLGIITWQKSTVSDFGGTSSTEAVTAQFIQSDGLGFAQLGAGGTSFPAPVAYEYGMNGIYGPYSAPPPACNASLPNTLEAGALTLSGPGLEPVVLLRSVRDGRLTYHAPLPPGILQGGAYQLAGEGGSQVGAFTANENIPAPITGIAFAVNGQSTSLQPGSNLPAPCDPSGIFTYCRSSYLFTWTGGDNRSVVTLQFIIGDSFRVLASAYGGVGQIWITPEYGAYPTNCYFFASSTCPLIPSGNVEVILTQTPYHAPSQPFTAPGLGWGGEGTWNYVWDFRGLTN